jgi:hypothetical protein
MSTATSTGAGSSAPPSSSSPWIVKPDAAILSTKMTGKAARPEDCNLVLFHGSGCPDGFTAAFAAWKLLGDRAEYVGMEHGPNAKDKLPSVAGKHVVIADYCFARDVMDKIKAEAASFIVLDHHASAQKELVGFSEAHMVFEMKQSGATLAWNYFHPETEVPLLFRYIEDKDIWRWAYKGSEAFSAAFGTVEYDFAVFDKLLASGEAGVEALIERGSAILAYKNGVRDSHVKRAAPCSLKIAPQYVGLIVNGSTQASEIGNAMCGVPGVQFGAIWSYDHRSRSIYVSLRSDSDEVDVSAIAKAMGGGGHKRAAGFTYLGKNIEDLLVDPAPTLPSSAAASAEGASAGAGGK